MATYQFAEVRDQELDALCQLHSVGFDLKQTISLCDSLVELCQMKPNLNMGELLDVYSVAILIRFARAVGDGVRTRARLKADRKSLPAALQEAWGYFAALRDKHIAHSVNAYEETKMRFEYVVGQEAEAVVSKLLPSRVSTQGLSSDEIASMKELCLALSQIIEARIKLEEARVLPILQSVPAKTLIDKGPRPWAPPDRSKVADSRRRS